ncbi:MAG: hypothetical protein PHQ74_08525 [Crocinitomicaceae bacterium]|nr:hypothetical protein [Crocinitomicaceae bacterium]
MFILNIVLAKTTFFQVASGTLYVSLVIIILFLIYKRILMNINRKEPSQKLYCELIFLENDLAKGMVEFYFTNLEKKEIRFEILNKEYETVQLLSEEEFEAGQHIVRFDSTSVANGNYFYQLKTDNQQTMRKMVVNN